jgi:hypothetical protein
MSGGNLDDARLGRATAAASLYMPDMGETLRSATAARDAVVGDRSIQARAIHAHARIYLSCAEEQRERPSAALQNAYRASELAAAVEPGDGPLRFEADLRLAHVLDINRELPDPVNTFEELVARGGGLGPGAEVRALVRLVNTTTSRSRNRIVAEEAIDRASELAARLDDEAVHAQLNLWHGCYQATASRPDEAQELLELARRSPGHDGRIAVCATIALAAPFYLRGETVQGDMQLRLGRDAARRAGMLRTRRHGSAHVLRFRGDQTRDATLY